MDDLVYFLDNSDDLFLIDWDENTITLIAEYDFAVSDLAVAPDGTLYAINSENIFIIDPETGEASLVASHDFPAANSLYIDPLGRAYIAGFQTSEIALLDLQTGATQTLAELPGFSATAEGDLAFHDGVLWVAAANNSLVAIDPFTGEILNEVEHGLLGVEGLSSGPAGFFLYDGDDVYRVEASGSEITAIDFHAELTGIIGADGAGGTHFGQDGLLLRGDASADEFAGGALDDVLIGLRGGDVLVGGGGDDFLNGGDGNDQIFGDDGDDAAVGGLGNDRLAGGNGDDRLDGGRGDDLILGEGGNNVLLGGLGEDRLFGGAGNDQMNGGEDRDILRGRDGNDLLVDPDGNNVLDGGGGNDAIYGGDGEDILLGRDGQDLLVGGDSRDNLKGMNGDDILIGGAGRDILNGAQGADLFVFQSVSDSTSDPAGRDTILGFARGGGDLMDLSAIDANLDTDGNDDFTIVDEFSGTAGELRYELTNTEITWKIQADVDGDGQADFELLVKANTMADDAFIL